jgi:hypothetical protein
MQLDTMAGLGLGCVREVISRRYGQVVGDRSVLATEATQEASNDVCSFGREKQRMLRAE